MYKLNDACFCQTLVTSSSSGDFEILNKFNFFNVILLFFLEIVFYYIILQYQ